MSKHVVIFDFSCDADTVPGTERRGGYEKNTKKKRSKKTKCNYKKYSGYSYTKKKNKQGKISRILFL
jgi:hypothetical protein